ncbi:hypothetical protein HMPREF0208_02637 [Citrobacter koseri]|nr:hypothetical protein HMPREF3220_02908 [Citrobacter koseri]KXA01316.1 hypothetical protein HMPREF3207_02942 [Citrobacter koseri]KXB43386.1 hypothetical protein HMPREF0208_02637 [Citrobacter koseri]
MLTQAAPEQAKTIIHCFILTYFHSVFLSTLLNSQNDKLYKFNYFVKWSASFLFLLW